MDEADQDRALTQGDAEWMGYRAVNLRAVFSLLFGAFAFIAMIHPALWWVPLVAVCLGIWARWQIAREPDSYLGRLPALLGILLGGFFLTAAPTHYYAQQMILERDAMQFVLRWAEAVAQGKRYAAHQATLDPHYRQPVGTNLDEYYSDNEEDRTDAESFFNLGVAKDLATMGTKTRVSLESTVSMMPDGTAYRIIQRYRAVPIDQPQAKPLRFQVDVRRLPDPSGIHWRLFGIADTAAFE